jgi:hypothetical protein
MKHLWYNNPMLEFRTRDSAQSAGPDIDRIANNYSRNGYRFVPLVSNYLSTICKIEVLMLRQGEPGNLFSSGDIDNRIKTLFDTLRMPKDARELGGSTPDIGEDPFFVLLEDDSLITHAAVETDMLLEPVSGDASDVRLVITVTVRPYNISIGNLDFV